MRRLRDILFLLVIFSIGCAPVRYVKPLEKNQLAVSGSLGGPLVTNFGPPIPLPLTTVGVGYGWKDDLTIFGAIHPTSILFGTVQWEAGVTKQWLAPQNWRPGISSTLTGNFAVDVHQGNFRFWPALDINAYWHYLQKSNYFYTGLSNWVELTSTREMGEKQEQHWIPAINLGHSWVHPKTNLTLEIKYLAPGNANDKVVTEYIGIGDRGALGIYFGIIRKF